MEDFEFEFVPEENQYPAPATGNDLDSDIDPRFTELLTIHKNSRLQVHTNRLQALFNHTSGLGLPLAIHFVLCPDTDHSSQLIGVLLQNRLEALYPTTNRNESLSNLFLAKNMAYKSKGIVAWSEPVVCPGADGRKVANYFIDIWGAFEENDPLYTVLAGLASLLASSIVCIQFEQITVSTWDWLKDVMLVALKSSQVDFQRLTFLIQHWYNGMFNPGKADGKRYIQETFFNPELEQSNSASIVKRLISQMDCFLFPTRREGDNIICNQHQASFQRLVLDIATAKSIDGYDANGEQLCSIFNQLPSLQTLLQFEDQLPLLNRFADEISPVENDNIPEVPIREDFDYGEPVVAYSLGRGIEEDHNDQGDTYGISKNVTAAPLVEGIFATWDADITPASLTFDSNTSIPILPEVEDFWNANTGDLWNTDEGSLFLPEQMLKDMVKNYSVDNLEAPAHPCFVNEGSNSTPVPEPVTKMVPKSTEEIIRSILDSVAKPSNLISQNKQTEVDKLPSTSINISTKPAEEIGNIYPKLTNRDTFDTKPQTSFNYNSLTPEFDLTSSDLLPQTSAYTKNGKDDSLDTLSNSVDTTSIDHNLVTIATDLFDQLHLPSNITVDKLLSQISSKYDTSLGRSNPDKSGLRLLLTNAFTAVGTYEELMDKAFDSNLFFLNEEMLLNTSDEVSKSILANPELELGSFAHSVQRKLKQVENLYIEINKDIRSKEKTCAELTLLLIERFYNEEMQIDTISDVPQFQQLHQKISDLCRKAFNTSYGDTNPDINQLWLQDLDSKLKSNFTNIETQFMSKYQSSEQLGQTLVVKYAATYKTEIDRQFRNPTMNAGHFGIIHDTACAEATRGFEQSSQNLLQGVQQKYLTKLKTEIEKIRHKVERQFHADKPSFADTVKKQNYGQIVPKNFDFGTPTPSSTNGKGNQNGHKKSGKNQGKSHPHPISQPIPVGIHFGLDFLSAGTIKDKNYKTIYGPSPNKFCINEEILIGEVCDTAGCKSVLLRDVLLNKDIESRYEFQGQNGKIILRVEDIIAYIFSKLHQILSSRLYTIRISYIVAIPTSFNNLIRTAFNNAFQIAGLNASLVRESCCLLSQMIDARIYKKSSNEVLVAIEDTETDACDLVYYTLKGSVRATQIEGRSPYKGKIPFFSAVWEIFNGRTPGIAVAFDKMPEILLKSSKQVFFLTKDGNRTRDIKVINSCLSQKMSHHSAKRHSILEGASILAAYHSDTRYRNEWDKNFSRCKLDEILSSEIQPNINSDIIHTGSNLPDHSIIGKSDTLQAILVEHNGFLTSVKDNSQQIYIQKKNELMADNNLKEFQKKAFEKILDRVMIEIQGEYVSAHAIRTKMQQAISEVDARLHSETNQLALPWS